MVVGGAADRHVVRRAVRQPCGRREAQPTNKRLRPAVDATFTSSLLPWTTVSATHRSSGEMRGSMIRLPPPAGRLVLQPGRSWPVMGDEDDAVRSVIRKARQHRHGAAERRRRETGGGDGQETGLGKRNGGDRWQSRLRIQEAAAPCRRFAINAFQHRQMPSPDVGSAGGFRLRSAACRPIHACQAVRRDRRGCANAS